MVTGCSDSASSRSVRDCSGPRFAAVRMDCACDLRSYTVWSRSLGLSLAGRSFLRSRMRAYDATLASVLFRVATAFVVVYFETSGPEPRAWYLQAALRAPPCYFDDRAVDIAGGFERRE